MKKILIALLSLSAASFAFAGDAAATKSDDKAKSCSSEGCCCCKESKASCSDKVACDVKTDAKAEPSAAATPEKK